MTNSTARRFLPLLSLGILLSPCMAADAVPRNQPGVAAPGAPGVHGRKTTPPTTPAPNDDLDEYGVVQIADPLERVNRGTFWLNHQIYRFLLRPVSKTYEAVLPQKLRTGVYNVFNNVEYPVRFVNDLLQARFDRAGWETEKFLLNSVAGVGGLFKVSDRFPVLAAVPPADTSQTFAKWGIGNGFYFVLPVLGPSTLRDTFGLAGDYALYPPTWICIYYAKYTWTLAFSCPDTARNMPIKLGKYDDAIKNAVDPYLAARSAYIQNRNQAARK